MGVEIAIPLDNLGDEFMGNSVKDKDLLKLLLKDGWKETGIKGSHHKIKKNGQTLIIPVHGKDMDKGLLQAILKKAGIDGKDVI